MTANSLRTRIQQLGWHRQRHGISGAIAYAWKSLASYSLMGSEYIFVVDLHGETYSRVQRCEPIQVEAYASMESVPQEDLQQITAAMGPAAVLFLRKFFARGARLWLGRHERQVVGFKWTLRGGIPGHHYMPIAENDAVSFAGRIFPQFRGQRFWQRLTAGLLTALKAEGISRVYFNVRRRNHAMLKAVRKAGIPVLGQVFTVRLPWYRLFLLAATTGNARPSPAELLPGPAAQQRTEDASRPS
jgi:hypothetical protein